MCVLHGYEDLCWLEHFVPPVSLPSSLSVHVNVLEYRLIVRPAMYLFNRLFVRKFGSFKH